MRARIDPVRSVRARSLYRVLWSNLFVTVDNITYLYLRYNYDISTHKQLKLMQEKGFVEYVKECLTLKYKDFSGRARRREFWFFWLCCFLTNCVASVIDHTIGLHSILSTIVALALFIPILAAGVRRLQDIGKPWQYILCIFIPFGIFYLIYLWAQDSQPGDNAYGPNPKGL